MDLDKEIQVFEKFALRYDRWYEKEPGKSIFKWELESLKKLIKKPLHPAIEIGVGSGRFASAIGIEYGIDPSLNLLKIAQKREIKVVCGKAENMPFKDASFKAAFLIVTLCFAKNHQEILEETFRILQNDGKLFIGMVFKDSPWGKYYMEKAKQGHPFYSVAQFLDFEVLRSLLSQNGFEIEEIYSTLFSSPPLVSENEKIVFGYKREAGFVALRAGKLTQK